MAVVIMNKRLHTETSPFLMFGKKKKKKKDFPNPPILSSDFLRYARPWKCLLKVMN